ncbi:TPA: flagellar basal body P-ring protein FlgI [Legionella pneumophila]|uniref:Flagellar P-ring protein n=2 Tax=Legionella pneumophila TaxID=446 RepID=FLGI_LEGPH|nr:flagellar basal body P-ring protein FlgI [Legionella pneumophila]Q5ZW64.2 RecName: Full=Flagellar P-ring protein; AltName: Full=Basal body P-ring protein; Flags: Precursor [Legionella pneumophila subsp. pneumophila str. Philadelphia 1]AGH54032.1 Flagellar P-ring protein FlgI [Legionella pneumophila subsp. pneumophila LPE509]AOU06044.1 flagellar P-ring protein [Legionella pneumophila]AOU09004.1 flagellar P-ring protein [Legionella pneumophila]AOU12006.1 flagellar P-ring protein [Legionella p
MRRMLVIRWILAIHLIATQVFAERIKDIATLAGVRVNQLVGYGLVVGLSGTGDKTGTKFTEDSFANMLTQLGINIPPGVRLNSKNIAAVMVTANLSSFMKKGQTMDVNISSIGDSKSLLGGTLLLTPLKGADGRVYAMSQGNVVVSGISASGSDGSSVTVNVPSGGRIPNGATIEADIPNPFYYSNSLTYNLHNPDFTTAKRMSDAINELMGPGTAKAIDAGSVVVTAPKKLSQRVDYVSVLENIEFKPGEAMAKIIINARTGTVVISSNVIVKSAAVSHGNLVVSITETPVISQPNAFASGRTVSTQQSQVNIQQKNNRAFILPKGTTLKDIVRGINAVGATPADVISILEALQQAGALSATLIVI